MEEKNMNIMEHASEFRKRLIIVLGSFIVLFGAAFSYVDQIYNWIVDASTIKLTVLGPTEILWVYFVLAGFFAITAVFPIALFHVWRFISPALSKDEKKAFFLYLPAIILFFFTGIGFGYYVLFPNILAFLTSLAGDEMNTMFTAEKYFRFLLNLTLPIAILFELPILVMFLTRIGIINPELLAKTRKVSYFVLTVVSTLVTPPDLVSAILVLAPLILLYELGMMLSKIVYRKKLKFMGGEGMRAEG
ncbi:twin-arginine translocase subunit TatC [Mesobacillus foraminis]|uniref:twin-arginine translocase subunit TatC n=1 Tax=Mesobacillus foraminis TaxID=279826 RepID=UPI000EF51076|nr:twin-arginine translocase subunit TatC [Mesobacillus foraminis]